ncbi:hypothetical protein ILYODFUR_036885 [Ilyodon furcidens]|uniref:Gamma-synuclein n=1 Tax=Ilyodon furcidens TaxID=33524 RepID=A0ABV0UPG9_9TELE
MGVAASCCGVFCCSRDWTSQVAHKSTEQANIVADTAVAGANEVAQATVEGVENAVVASGLVKTTDVPKAEAGGEQVEQDTQ